MRYVEAAGLRSSVIGLGTWQFGSREWGYGDRYANGEAARIVHRAIELGVTLIDTAEIYALGRSERIVGAAIAGRRDDVVVATKILPVAPFAPVVVDRARRSAQRLGVELIDLYQLHWPNPLVPVGTQVRGLRRLLDAGLVRHVGVSNHSLRRWRSVESALGAPVVSNQVRYSLVDRRPDRELIPHAVTEGRLVIAYSPLGQGFLSARYDAANPPSGSVRAGNPLFLPENLERAAELLGVLRRIAARHDATPAQVALAWVTSHPNVVAIPGASSVEQLERNAEAADLELSEDEDDELTEASNRFRPLGGLAAAPKLLRARIRR